MSVEAQSNQQLLSKPNSYQSQYWVGGAFQPRLNDAMIRDSRTVHHDGKSLTNVVRTDLQGFVTPHYHPHFLSIFMREKTDIPSTAFFPFCRFAIKAEEFSTPMVER